tara:strand:- start:167 stop:442 length:276 start_codon:yes stop_codon:yes gene_type:complete
MDYAKKYLKYKDKATQDKFNKLVDEYRIDNALETAIDIALREVRENKKLGGLIDKPLGAGGKKSGPPPKRGPNPQGLNIKSNTAKTVKLEK